MKISSAQRVQQCLLAHNHENTIMSFPAGTRSAIDAAKAVGCRVEQIVKSMIFRSVDRPVLVLISGSNLVDETKVSILLKAKIERADGRWVRDVTGFAIGGVAPIGHLVPPFILIDEDILPLPLIWAAAGSPMKVFSTSPSRLIEMTKGQVSDIRKN